MAGLPGDQGFARPCAGVRDPAGGNDISLGPKGMAVRPGEWRGEEHLQRLRDKSEQASWRRAQGGEGAEASSQSCGALDDGQLRSREAPEASKAGWAGLCTLVLGHLRAEFTSPAHQKAVVHVRLCAHACARANGITSLFSIPKETLRKFQAWGQARAELAEHKAQAEKEMILAQGGDAFKHLFHQRRRQELEAQKR